MNTEIKKKIDKDIATWLYMMVCVLRETQIQINLIETRMKTVVLKCINKVKYSLSMHAFVQRFICTVTSSFCMVDAMAC